MIDTIRGSIRISRNSSLIKVLENQRTIINEKTKSKKIVGNIKNISFHIYYNPDGKICRVDFIGSLHKYVHDNNFVSFTRLGVEKAIKALSKITGLPLHNAILKRFDFGACFLMNSPIVSYLLLFDELPGRYKKTNIRNETIYFDNARRCLAFYDKTKENKIRKGNIPSAFKDKYVLRYELRYYKALGEQFNMERINVSDLYSMEFYNRVKKRWVNGYFKIIKFRIQNLGKVNNVKSLLSFLALNGIIKIGGLDKVTSMIDAFCLKENIDACGKHRLKKRVRTLFLDTNISNSSKEITELNKRVKNYS